MTKKSRDYRKFKRLFNSNIRFLKKLEKSFSDQPNINASLLGYKIILHINSPGGEI